jgi:hypothetical protein
MRKIKLLFSGLLFATLLQAQETFPVNGVANKRDGYYAFVNATIVNNITKCHFTNKRRQNCSGGNRYRSSQRRRIG